MTHWLDEAAKIVRDIIRKNPKITKEELLKEVRELREQVAVSDSVVAVVKRGNGEPTSGSPPRL